MDIGRPIHLDVSSELLTKISEFADGLVVPSAPPDSPQPPTQGSPTAAFLLKSVSLETRELSILMSTAPHPDSPKISAQLSGVKGAATMTTDDQGTHACAANLAEHPVIFCGWAKMLEHLKRKLDCWI